MKIKALVFAAIAASLSASAFAQSYEYRDRVGDRYEHSDGYYRDGDRYDRDGRYDRHDVYDRYDRDERYYRRDSRRDGSHRWHREGAGPHRDLYIGSRLPKPFWTVSHRVDNWHRYRLGAPAYRHHWVRIGNDFVMVSQVSGRIARVVLG